MNLRARLGFQPSSDPVSKETEGAKMSFLRTKINQSPPRRPPHGVDAIKALPAGEQPTTGRPDRGGPGAGAAFALLAVAFFMTIVDLTIINVALPTIGRKLHFPEADLQWVVTAYGLTFGGFLLLGGRAADLLGRRRLLMTGLAVFTAASLACALAPNDGFMIVMRGVQGLGAALMLPAALSSVMNMFAEGAERNKALGIWGGIGAGGATVGLLAGGALTRYLGWEYIFFLNIPIGAAVMALAPRVVPESRLSILADGVMTPSARSASPGASWLLVYAISQAPRWVGAPPDRGHCWPRRLRFSSGSSSSRPGPKRRCCPMHLFRSSTVAGANVVGFLLAASFYTFIFVGHPVHAAGARVLGAKDRGRLANGLAHLGGLRRPLADARHQDLGQGRHGTRDGAHRRRGGLGHPSAGPRPFLGALGRAVLRDRRRHRLRLHTGVDRGPGRSAANATPASPRACSTPPSNSVGRSVLPSPRPSPLRVPTPWPTSGYGTAAALTGGFSRALWVCGLVGLAAVPLTFVLVRRQELARAVAASLAREAPALVPAD